MFSNLQKNYLKQGDIDPEMKPMLKEINETPGFATHFSCTGHCHQQVVFPKVTRRASADQKDDPAFEDYVDDIIDVNQDGQSPALYIFVDDHQANKAEAIIQYMNNYAKEHKRQWWYTRYGKSRCQEWNGMEMSIGWVGESCSEGKLPPSSGFVGIHGLLTEFWTVFQSAWKQFVGPTLSIPTQFQFSRSDWRIRKRKFVQESILQPEEEVRPRKKCCSRHDFISSAPVSPSCFADGSFQAI